MFLTNTNKQEVIGFVKRNIPVLPFLICAILAYYNISDCNKVTALETEQDYRNSAIFYFASTVIILVAREYYYYRKKNNKLQIMPLHDAAIAGELAVIKDLVSKGADVNAKDKEKTTPLHEAIIGIRKPKLEMVKFLISSGADVNCKNISELTPLHFAVFAEELEIVKYLASNGADINVKFETGKTLLMYAKEINTEIAEYLKSIGAK